MQPVLLPKPTVYSYRESLRMVDRGYNDCLQQVTEGVIRKAVMLDNSPALLQINEEPEAISITMLKGHEGHRTVRSMKRYVDNWFDLKRDLSGFYAIQHPVIRHLTKTYHGLRMVAIDDLFEAFAWGIIGQQVNLSFAHRIKNNLVKAYGGSSAFEGEEYRMFPTPQDLQYLSVADLRALKFSKQKADYLLGIARQMAAGDLSKPMLEEINDSEEVLKRLLAIKGVGEWTANYVRMKCLKHMDAVPYGDAGLHQAFKKLLGFERNPTRAEAETFFSHAPLWGSYLAIYLWRTLV